MRTVELLGGPMDGKTLEVSSGMHDLKVAVPKRWVFGSDPTEVGYRVGRYTADRLTWAPWRWVWEAPKDC